MFLKMDILGHKRKLATNIDNYLKMQIKATVKYHLIPVIKVYTHTKKSLQITNIREDMEKEKEYLCTIGGM